MPTGVELVVLVIVAAVGLCVLEAVIRRSLLGVGLALVCAAIYTTVPFPPFWSMGGTNVFLWDVVGLLLIAAAVARLLRAHRVSGLQWVLIAFGVVVLVSVTQGVVQHGLNTAVNDFRHYFYFVSTALYCSTIRPERALLDRVARAWLLFAGFLLLLAAARLAVLPLNLGGWAQSPDGLRVLHAAATLVLAQAFVIGAFAWARGEAPVWVRRMTPVFLAAVVLLQHRSVWAVLLVSVALLVLAERRAANKLLPATALAVVLLGAVGLTLLDDRPADLTTELTESAADRNTWEWRIDGWRALITQAGPDEPVEYLLGQPFGGGWERVMNGHVVDVSPHNYYVQTYLRTGVLGLGLLVGLYATVLWRAGASPPANGLFSRKALVLVLVAHPIFFIPYSPAPEQAIILGLAMGLAAAAAPRAPSRPQSAQVPRII